MKLRTRMWIAFAVVLIIPITLVTIASIGMFRHHINTIERIYGVTLTSEYFTSAPIQLVGKRAREIQEDLEKLVEEDSGQFRQQAFLQELDQQISQKGFNLAIRVQDTMIYASPKITSLLEVLPPYGSELEEDASSLIGEEQRVLRQIDFRFAEGQPASVFILSDNTVNIPEIKRAYGDILAMVVMVLLITAAIMTGWIYCFIVQPLGELKTAANKIKEGDLNFTIEGNEDDEIGQLCIAFEEMRRRLQETTEETIATDAESKELISNISHDLKTPITAIKGYVEGIMDGVADTPEKMDRYIHTIYNKANDMDRLIDELTFYSRIDTNRIPYNFAKINVGAYFQDCAEELGMELASKNVDFNYANYCDGETMVIADAEQISRVINNIISNSIKYCDKAKGMIHMRVSDVGDFIQVEIEDNGKGIAQKDLPYIFDRFYRTDSSRNSAKGGSGIGLSIVRKILEDHGGRVWATSREGTGTVMHFVLRKCPDEAAYGAE